MTKLILIRHGQTEWNITGRYQGQSDVALSEEGIRQAELLAAHFPADHLDAVYTSDLQRAVDTARRVADRFDCQVQPDAELREINFGQWEGLTYDQIAAQWPDEIGNFFTRPDILQIPQGEGFVALQQRVVKRVRELAALHDDHTIALVAHGAILRTILAAALHMPLRYLWSLRQDNTAVNILRYEDGHCLVELMNSTAHLSGAVFSARDVQDAMRSER